MGKYSLLTKDQFKNKLKNLSMSQNDFSKLTGCAYITIKRWKDNRIPLWVDYVLSYMEIKSITDYCSSQSCH